MPVRVKHCKICDKEGHTPFYCPKKARNPLMSTKRLKSNGKHHQLWKKTKRRWFKHHVADNYDCYLCGKRMLPSETTLDHIKSRGRHPELRYELTNLAPCCWDCNGKKGSRDLEEL